MKVEDKICNYIMSDSIREQALLLVSIFNDYDRDVFCSDGCLLLCVYAGDITYEIYIYSDDEFDFIIENFNTEVLRIECVDAVHLMSLIEEHCGVELDD